MRFNLLRRSQSISSNDSRIVPSCSFVSISYGGHSLFRPQRRFAPHQNRPTFQSPTEVTVYFVPAPATAEGDLIYGFNLLRRSQSISSQITDTYCRYIGRFNLLRRSQSISSNRRIASSARQFRCFNLLRRSQSISSVTLLSCVKSLGYGLFSANLNKESRMSFVHLPITLVTVGATGCFLLLYS